MPLNLSLMKYVDLRGLGGPVVPNVQKEKRNGRKKNSKINRALINRKQSKGRSEG